MFLKIVKCIHWLGAPHYYRNKIYLIGGRHSHSNRIEYIDVNKETNGTWITSQDSDNLEDSVDSFGITMTPNAILYRLFALTSLKNIVFYQNF